MLTPSYLANVAQPMIVLWEQLEDDILSDIAVRIAKSGKASDITNWQIRKAREMGLVRSNITKKLSRMSGMSSKTVSEIVNKACEKAMAEDDVVYKAAGMRPVPLGSSKALQEVILAGVRKTNGLMSNFTRTTADTASKAFENAMDRAYMQVISGAFSQDQAIRIAVKQLAKEGMESVAYPSGRIEKLDAAARRAIVTGVNQTTAELQLARADELESDLVETTSHAGARPSHAVWQGRVFSLHGKTRGYADFYAETGYGTGDGLCGWNCRHSFYPYILGFSSPSFSRDPANEIGKSNDLVYDESQKQRAYERAIRESKRECLALDAAMAAASNDELRAIVKNDFTAASVRLKKREAALKEYLKHTARMRDASREVVNGFGRSTSAKAVWANRKAVST